MIKYLERYTNLRLLLFVILMLGFTIDVIPVTIMEARNFISAREMITDDNWILTTMNGEARYQKPPLPTWVTAVFGMLFGMKSLLALRWPALLFMASIGISIYLFSKKLQLNKSHSLMNGFIVLSSFYVIGIIIEAPWDIYTHAFMLMALYQLFQMFQSQKTSIVNSLLFVLFLACSVLSKGPVSLYVLFLSFVIAYGISFKLKGRVLHFLKLMSLLIFGIVLGGWWYFHVRIADPETFAAIASKETSNWSSYNVRPFYYYWSFFIQSGLWTIPAFISLLYPYMKSRVSNLKAYRFSFFWTIIAVALLSLIPEKKSRYLMPVLIPLALNIGFYIDYLTREFKNIKHKRETIPVYFAFGLIASMGLLFGLLGFFFGPFLTGWVLIRFLLITIILLLIGIFLIKSLKSNNIKISFYLLISFMMSLGLFALPISEMQIQADYKSVSELTDSKLSLYSINEVSPEAIYHYGDKIPKLKSEEGLQIPEEKEFHLLTNSANELSSYDQINDLYTIEFIAIYDLNTSKKGTRSHRSRLVNHLYRLSLK